MPALFDVPGWSVPSAPVSTQRQSRKRKRAASSEEQDLLRTAQANLDKLIDSLGTGDGGSLKKKSNKSSHRDQHPKAPGKPHNQSVTPVSVVDPPTTSSKKNVKKQKKKQTVQPISTSEHSAAGLTSLQQSFKKSLDGARFRSVLASRDLLG